MTWGLLFPNDIVEKNGKVIRSWGARAIFDDRGNIDLVYDRQEVVLKDGDTTIITAANDTKVHEFFSWVDNKALPWLREEAKRLTTKSEETISFSVGRFSIAASPKRSYGYLYITAVEHGRDARYELAAPVPTAKWSGKTFPAIGDRVNVTMNGFGPGTVIGYCAVGDILGIHVKVDKQPDWHIKQGGRKYIVVFGSEVEILPEKEVAKPWPEEAFNISVPKQ